MFYHVFGPMGGRRHEWTLYTRSGLEEILSSALHVGGRQFCIYGDSGYNRGVYLEIPFQGETTAAQGYYSKSMSEGRVMVEWMFKEVKQYWAVEEMKSKIRVNQLPVGKLYLMGILLSNIRNCYYPNQVAQMFLPSSIYIVFLTWRSSQ